MGKLITFWSPVKGQAKATASLCAVVSALALQYPQTEIAVAYTGTGSTDLEDRLDKKIGFGRKKELYDRTGLSALILNYKQGELTSEKIRRCAIPLLLPNVHLFPAAGEELWLVQKDDPEELKLCILSRKLAQEYGITCLDLETGMQKDSFRYMEAADVAVIVLPQNPAVWELYSSECRKRLDGKKIFLLLGGSMGNSRYGTAALARRLKRTRERLGQIPLNAGFMDALSEGRTMEFFLKNENVRKREENYEFMEQTKRAAGQIRQYAAGE